MSSSVGDKKEAAGAAAAKVALVDDKNFVEDCKQRVGYDCGYSILKFMLNGTPISEDCRRKIAQLGEPGHTVLMRTQILTKPQFKDANHAEVLLKGDELLKDCQKLLL